MRTEFLVWVVIPFLLAFRARRGAPYITPFFLSWLDTVRYDITRHVSAGCVGVDQHALGEIAVGHGPLHPGAAAVAAQRAHRRGRRRCPHELAGAVSQRPNPREE